MFQIHQCKNIKYTHRNNFKTHETKTQQFELQINITNVITKREVNDQISIIQLINCNHLANAIEVAD